MCRIIILALGTVLLANTAAAANLLLKGIRGKDDRQLERMQKFPWSAIGRVNVRTRGVGFCFGTLIGPSTVLMAALCFWNKQAWRWASPCSIHYFAADSLSKYLAHSKVKSYRLPDPNLPSLVAIKKDLTKNWAIVRLGNLPANKSGLCL